MAGFEPVEAAFARLVAQRPGGAALCAYLDGRCVVDLWGGATYRPDTLQVMFSVTKGVAAIVLALLVQDGVLDVDASVCEYWPEFAAGGKQAITIGQLFSHQAGLPVAREPLPFAAWHDGRMEAALERQEPFWTPAEGHGYHGLSWGLLADAVVRRVTGKTIDHLLGEWIREPLGVDFWIGVPEVERHRVAAVIEPAGGVVTPPEMAAAKRDATSLVGRVSALSPPWRGSDFNEPHLQTVSLPSINGIGSARALARLYAACVSAVDGSRLLTPATLERVTAERAGSRDLLVLRTMRFGVGFQLPTDHLPMAGPRSFGHDGYGGGLAFADSELKLGFGFTTDCIPSSPGLDPCLPDLVAVLHACVEAQ
jgi:CubicO group peptidase (beta-lactamase class C family)